MRRITLSAAALLLSLGASTQASAQVGGTIFTGTLPPNLVGNLGAFTGVSLAPAFATGDFNAAVRQFSGFIGRYAPVNAGLTPPLFATGRGQLPGLAGLPNLDDQAFVVGNALNGAFAPYTNDPQVQMLVRMTSSGPLAFPDVNGQFGAAEASFFSATGLPSRPPAPPALPLPEVPNTSVLPL